MIRPRNDYVSASSVIAILGLSRLSCSHRRKQGRSSAGNPSTGYDRSGANFIVHLDSYLSAADSAAYDARASIVFWLDTADAFSHGSV